MLFFINLNSLSSHQLLGATCICTKKEIDPNAGCYVPVEDSGLFWDGVCFAFLIIQRRLFSSHYFCHVINEAKASLILASRGNELIDELRIKEVKLEAEREAQILQKIKTKMDRIKATQQRVLEENEPKHHAAGKFHRRFHHFHRSRSIFVRVLRPASEETFVMIYDFCFLRVLSRSK